MTTDIVRTFIDDLDQLPDEIPGAATLEPGRINWYHGVDAGKVKTPGVFFARETAFTVEPGSPWELDDRYAGKGEVGYSAPELHIAFLGWREQWFLPGEHQGDRATWLPGYQDKAKKLIEYLVRVQGLDEPMVLSVSGLYKSKPIADLLSNYRRVGALAQAMRKTKRNLPLWSFWLPIGGQRGADLKPVYIKAETSAGEAKGSVVTPPALIGLPVARTAAEIMADAALWQEYHAANWFTLKRLPRDTAEGSYVVSETKALPAPRKNVPVTMEEESLPF
jgi:hypothetical protein